MKIEEDHVMNGDSDASRMKDGMGSRGLVGKVSVG